MRILYVEDHSANLFLVQRVARMGNHEVINYTDGESALANFEKDNPDMVLMDVQLPGKMTGLDVVKALRARGHKTPMIAVTAYAMMGDRERCIEAGCDGYIAKPLPVTELVETIKRYEKLAASPSAPAPAASAPPAPTPAPAASAPQSPAPVVQPPAPAVVAEPKVVPPAPTPILDTAAKPAETAAPNAAAPPPVSTEDETAPAPPSYPAKPEPPTNLAARPAGVPVQAVTKTES